MLRKIILFLLLSVSVTNLFAQSPDDREPSCREKCSFAFSNQREQQLTFFQSPSMNKYDINYLKLDISVEANSTFIEGTALTRAFVVQALDSFIIEFKNNMTVDSVFINGNKRTFTRADDHLKVPLPATLAVGNSFDALVYYRGNASSDGVFAGTMASNGLVYTASLSESYQAREWFPAKQLLKDKIDSADIWITTSSSNKAGSNGLLKAIVDKPGNKKQYQWKTRYPMAYYLVSFAVGNYMEYLHYAKPAAIAPDSILIQDYIVDNPTFFATTKPNLDKTPPFLEKLSELYGLYPFHREKYGHSHANIGGGMEHQTMSTMSSFATTIIAHELGHQWFGDNVTCATWNHIWINEGFASYTEYLMMEKLPALFTGTAATFMQNVHNDVMASASGSVFVPDASLFDENRIFSSRFTYNKGGAIIHTLRFEMQDDAKFFQTLQTFQNIYRDSVATAEDFKAVAESVCGRSFTDFFNQWYYGQGYPTVNVDYGKVGDSIQLRVSQTTSAPSVTPLFKGLYEFTIRTGQGDTIVIVNVTANNQVFKFKSPRTPSGVVIDPNNWIINKTGSITTATPSIDVSNDVTMFPNPSPGVTYLKFPRNWFNHLELYDVTGKLLRRENIPNGTSQFTLNTEYATGLYFIRMWGKGRNGVKKLVIQ
ncbi:MAG: T9SS type A sorting domain-containing protein [Chitinophagaceae bacterium]|nr:T9SS type A sorting domain-containing protein [Chitinophagaceae bacterium]